MKNKEEVLFLYIVFKRRQKLNQNSWGKGNDKDFIVDLKPPMTKASRKGTVVNAQVLVSLLEQTTLNLSPEEDLNEENDTLRNQSPFSQRF